MKLYIRYIIIFLLLCDDYCRCENRNYRLSDIGFYRIVTNDHPEVEKMFVLFGNRVLFLLHFSLHVPFPKCIVLCNTVWRTCYSQYIDSWYLIQYSFWALFRRNLFHIIMPQRTKKKFSASLLCSFCSVYVFFHFFFIDIRDRTYLHATIDHHDNKPNNSNKCTIMMRFIAFSISLIRFLCMLLRAA